jgi:hypothetical protein
VKNGDCNWTLEDMRCWSDDTKFQLGRGVNPVYQIHSAVIMLIMLYCLLESS